ncbi:MAG: ATP-dependent Clp endopeptidase proteolytic subunit ClpP [Verrucomicrobiota bacterium]|jgi:ATP-dependent Clp protease protease subunit
MNRHYIIHFFSIVLIALLGWKLCATTDASGLVHSSAPNTPIPNAHTPPRIEFSNLTIDEICGKRSESINAQLLKDRTVVLSTQIDESVANSIVAQLLFLQSEDPKKPIKLLINSPGGSVTAGMMIYDTMQFLTCEVETVCLGQAASMGAILLCGGKKGKRQCLPNSRIMIHQPWGTPTANRDNTDKQITEIRRIRKILNSLIAQHTSQNVNAIELATEKDCWMNATEAKAFGMVDVIVGESAQ